MSGTIRPVTSRVPSSWEVWDETQLPLAVTVQPLWTPPPPPTTTMPSGQRDNNQNNDDNDNHIVYTPPPLQQIPKCQHCGAPHPDESTQNVLSRPPRGTVATHAVGTSSQASSSHTTTSTTTFLCYLCHQISTVSTLVGKHHHHHHHHHQSTTTSVNQQERAHRHDDDNDSTFALPLRLQPRANTTTNTNHTHQQELVYRVPAVSCPVLWYIVLDAGAGGGGATAQQQQTNGKQQQQQQQHWYWTHVSQCLQATFEVIPAHVHVAIILAYPTGGHGGGQQQEPFVGIFQMDAAVPHVRRYPAAASGADWATLLVEAAVPVQYYRSNLLAIAKACAQMPSFSRVAVNHNDDAATTTTTSWTFVVEQIATGLLEVGQAAGQRKDLQHTWLPYAGAFCTCFRASNTTATTTDSRRRGQGHHANTHQSSSSASRQQSLARLCAQAVLTTQTVFVIDPTITESWYDAVYEHPPILSSVESPALAWYAVATDVTATQGWATWQATWPWRKSVAYGGNVRLRTSPGLVVATDDDDEWPEQETNNNGTTATAANGDDKAARVTTRILPKDGGLTGPAIAVPESDCLWSLPSLDPYTTLVIDLALDDDTDLSSRVSDAPRPKVGMLQVCVAYTALESDEDGKVWTVRRIKVAHRAMQRVATVESLYRRVDPEALAVVLLHKLVRCPIDQRRSIGEEWLEAFLVAVYKSALEEDKRQENLRQHNIPDNDGYFLPAERLLSKSAAGELSATDILLAQGHRRLRPIVLLMFLLLQQCQTSNTMSASSSSSSLDHDGLSLSDLVHMSPDSLTRFLAPRLQLWSNDEVLVDLIDLHEETVVKTIHEEMALLKNPRSSLLIVLDAPDQIIVGNARACLPGSMEVMNKLPAQLGPNLQATLKDMAASYPTPPPILYGGTGSWLTEVCREDLPLGTAPNFATWRATVAQAVHKDLVRRRFMEVDYSSSSNNNDGETDAVSEV